MKFGDNLKYLRKVNNLSQEKLADKLGVSRQSVSKWECGDAYPEMKHIIVLCDLFHCKINDLVHSNLSDINELDEEIQQSVVKFKKDKQDKMQLLSKLMYMFAKFWKFSSIVALIIVLICSLIVPGILFSKQSADFIGQLSKDYSWMGNVKPLLLLLILELLFVTSTISSICHLKMSHHLEKLSMNFYVEKTPFIYENIQHIKKTIFYLITVFVLSICTQTIFTSIDTGSFVFKGDIIHLVVVVIAFLVIYIFEYGYEIQLDSKGVMYGEVDEEEKKSAIAFLNKNIVQYTRKILIILIVVGIGWMVISISKARFEFLMNLPEIEEKDYEVIFSLEELGYAESDVNNVYAQKNIDGSYWYSLNLDNSTSKLTPSKQHVNYYFDIYQYADEEIALKEYCKIMVDNKRGQMYDDNYVRNLPNDTYYYIKVQNIEEYMLPMDAELWEADKAFMLYNENNYSAKYAEPYNEMYILKDNEILLISVSNLFTFTDDQVSVLKTLFDRVDVVFNNLDSPITE